MKSLTQRLKTFCGNHKSTLMLYGTAVIMLACLLAMFVSYTGGANQKISRAIVLFGSDIILIYSPFWLFSNRWKWTITIPLWIVTIILLINIWYYRCLGTIMPVSALMMIGNVNSVLVDSTIGAIRWIDILFLLPASLVTFYCCYQRKNISTEKKYSRHSKFTQFIASICLFIGGNFMITHMMMSKQKESGNNGATFGKILATRFNPNTADTQRFFTLNGLTFYMAKLLYFPIEINTLLQDLSDDQLSEINDYLSMRDDECKGLAVVENYDKKHYLDNCRIA